EDPHRAERPGRVVAPVDLEAGHVDDVVGVEVAEDDGVELRRVEVPQQRAEGPRAEVEDDAPRPGPALAVGAVGLDEVAGGGGLGAGHRPGAAHDRQPHAVTSSSASLSTRSTSGPRNRRASREKLSASPVARNRCAGGGAARSRSRSWATSIRKVSFAVSSALDTRVTSSPMT